MLVLAELVHLAYACCKRIAQGGEGAKAILLAAWGLWVAANGSSSILDQSERCAVGSPERFQYRCMHGLPWL